MPNLEKKLATNTKEIRTLHRKMSELQFALVRSNSRAVAAERKVNELLDEMLKLMGADTTPQEVPIEQISTVSAPSSETPEWDNRGRDYTLPE